MPFNNPGEVDAFTLSSVADSWRDGYEKLKDRNEKLERDLKAADKAISRFERDYENVPFNHIIFYHIENYRAACKELDDGLGKPA